MSPWWSEPQRIVQTNLRLTDADLDPVKHARDVIDFGATALLFNVGGIFAWYPTELELQPRNPYLNRDLLGDMLTAAKAEGLNIIGRYDLSKATSIAYERHPDWFVVTPEGKPIEYNGTYQACVNGGWYREQAPRLLEESLGRYPIEAVFFNMFGYVTNDYSYVNHGICQCTNCRRRFKEYIGESLPKTQDQTDPLYRQYLKFQDETSAELTRDIYSLVKKIRPNIGLANMGGSGDFIRREVNRMLSRPQPEWAYTSGDQAREAQSAGRGVPYSSAITHFFDFAYRNTADSAPGQVLRLAQQIANGALPHYYFMGPIDRQQDRKPIPAIRETFHYFARHQDVYARSRSAATIALYHSRKARRFHDPSGIGDAPAEAFCGAYAALLEAGLCFDEVSDTLAGAPDFPAALSRYELVVMPNVTCLGEAEAAALDEYVAGGGNLLVTGRSGTLDATGAPREVPALRSLPVEKVRAIRTGLRGSYVTIDGRQIGAGDTEIAMLDGYFVDVEPKPDATALYGLLAPQRFGPPELCFPEEEDTVPAGFEAAYGMGRVVYLPWEVDVLYQRFGYPEHRALIAHHACELAQRQLVRIDDPSRLELTVRQLGEKEYLVHLINYSGQHGNVVNTPATIYGRRLAVRANVVSAESLISGGQLRVEKRSASEENWIDLPAIGAFETLLIRVS